MFVIKKSKLICKLHLLIFLLLYSSEGEPFLSKQPNILETFHIYVLCLLIYIWVGKWKKTCRICKQIPDIKRKVLSSACDLCRIVYVKQITEIMKGFLQGLFCSRFFDFPFAQHACKTRTIHSSLYTFLKNVSQFGTTVRFRTLNK